MAHHHHKSNERVEGNPDTGHSRGMPRRPDETELEERTRDDRRDAGSPVGKWEDSGNQREEEQAKTDREQG
ncbi:hypothetical protein AV521_03700 [Streptomyces sp. IMTB 2501]|uniref:hypothetical protein n=1 Tax=Streptomyces sp. IMTB 2501 TaxID=1776340 RepID=UPI00096F6E3E|nr:hypothetical protein [Streptomyces sp. IMTB 2501]OLZ74873.1 hypothetical protein AV521_03700 [Streptomyces sp. IMTB 2501]